MCGIAGIISSKHQEDREHIMGTMLQHLAHRGPNASGMLSEDYCTLGHQRLSIIDTSADANQPFVDISKRYLLVFNGEIYNHQEIRRQLNIAFRTSSDTETLLYAYHRWGSKCLEKLNGMFAFAIWDAVEKLLFVARDRLGIKPFYYSFQEDNFVFASEVRALLHTNLISRKITHQGVSEYLSFQTVHAPRTIIENVLQLESGHFGILKEGKFNVYPYWQIDHPQEFNNYSYDKITTEIKRRFLDAVEKRLLSDVPIGAFLSGGIDSSAIVAAMSQVSTKKISTFSVGFQEDAFDESAYAKLVAQKYQTDHREIVLSSTNLREEIPTILSKFDVPSGDGVNTYIISEAVKKAGITVALSGLGGDELFAGYPIFKQMMLLNKFRFWWYLPVYVRNLLAKPFSVISSSKQAKLVQVLTSDNDSFSQLYPHSRTILSKSLVKRLLVKELEEDLFQTQIEALNLSAFSTLSQVSIAEIVGYTQNVLLRDTDQMSMAHALEVRVPFFDHSLVEYVLQLPDIYKYPKTPKKLLIDALAPMIPPEIVNRKKMGFTFPWQSWMKGELQLFCFEGISVLLDSKLFQADNLLQLWKDFLSDEKTVHWASVWVLVVLGHWMKTNHVEA